MAAGFQDKEQKLREDLLEFIHDEEYSDASIRTFRIQSYTDYKKALCLTIHAKTRVGAIIAYADWSSKDENAKSEISLQWEYLVYLIKETEETEDFTIQHCADKLEEIMFQGGDDNIIVEITQDETLTPFPDAYQKITGKKE